MSAAPLVRRAVLGALLLLAPSLCAVRAGQTVLLEAGSDMKWLANSVDPGLGTTWTGTMFDDSAWTDGVYGVGYELGAGGAENLIATPVTGTPLSIYTRTTFDIVDPADVVALLVGADYDDGYTVWINGIEVYRSPELPSTGFMQWNTEATLHESSNGLTPDYTPLNDVSVAAKPWLVPGPNVMAVGVWNAVLPSSDLVLVPQLIIEDTLELTRGPYLQMGDDTSVIVRWRTNGPTESRVIYGDAPGNLTLTELNSTLTGEHEVELTGLQPNTRYYYAIGTPTEIHAGDDPDHFFVTSPAPGMGKPTRVWIIGDSGTGNGNVAAVRDAYYNYVGTEHTDIWMMLGDNAYPNGTDDEYQTKLFEIFPDMLRKSVLWPAIGNHDAISSVSTTQLGPYFTAFTLPVDDGDPGMPSGTEAYYSFDYGNIHFVVLDSSDSSRLPGSNMLMWLEADLAATAQDWIIVNWHHPAYSKGSHDSDTEIELMEMRQHVVPILDDHGVDLTFTGHSHSFERTYMIEGHYGDSDSFDESMKALPGNGVENEDGAYAKPFEGPDPHSGIVHTVAGSGGQTSGGTFDHEAIYISFNVLGSVVLDVNGNRADVRFLNSSGAVIHHFTMTKGAGELLPVADFSLAPVIGAAPLVVDFTDLSQNGPTGWDWDFENDDIFDSAAENPVHQYTDIGLYSVKLRATNAAGSDELMRADQVCVHGGAPGAVSRLLADADRQTMTWDPYPSASRYDVVKGDLMLLRATDGDFALSLSGCLVDDGLDEQLTDPAQPLPGQAMFYLVRAGDCAGQTGSYDALGTGQAYARDLPLQGGGPTCACETLDDLDADGFCNGFDECTDGDGDGFGDPGFPSNTCPPDNCPTVSNDQSDFDGDLLGDACDGDDDNDGVLDGVDTAQFDPDICDDADGDGCDDCSVGTDGFGPLPDNDPANDGTDFDGDGDCDTGDGDDDNDGVLDGADTAQFDPDICDDADGDGCDDCAVGSDGLGPLPDNDPADDGADFDGDGGCDTGDGDDDNDGILDGVDTAQFDPDICDDADGDGCDDCSVGTDGLGPLPDNDPAADGADFDGDGDCDTGDGDDDNDGVLDGVDTAQFDPDICDDADGDGCDDCAVGSDGLGPLPDNDAAADGADFDGDGDCDTGDGDDDNDGVLDGVDTAQFDPDICDDADGDGCDDCAVGSDGLGPLPDNDPAADGADFDGDGDCDTGDGDDDNDGVLDGVDTAQFDPDICDDTDGDGCDDCSVGSDGLGPLPDNDPADDGADFDGDGDCDTGDGDDDNDGVLDGVDTAQFDPDICDDADGDGCDDCAIGTDGLGPLSDNTPANDGTDLDGDGICGVTDLCDGDPAKTDPGICGCGVADTDTDGDTDADCNDTDDDNDGVTDGADSDALDPSVCTDADLDGCDDCAIGTDGLGPLPDNTPANDGTDLDADGICSVTDLCDVDPAKTDPGICGCGVADTDTDGDTDADCNDPDDDNDGVADGGDGDALDPSVCADSDLDGCDDCAIGTDGFGALPDNTPTNDGTDLDGDGICSVTDLCDADPAKTDPGQCGCGVVDTDTDGDTNADCNDPDDDNDGVLDGVDGDALDPSVCTDADLDGCDDCAIGTDGFGSLPDNTPANDGTDLDGDGICSVTDLCDADPAKTDPGICGCGVADTDTDGDTDADCNDPDDDNDGVLDGADSDALDPSVCTDADLDGCDDCAIGTDGFGALPDNTPANDGTDLDGDGICSVTDLCDADPAKIDPGQCGCGVVDTDTDGDTNADCNDPDDDNDGVLDGVDGDALDPSVCTDADLDGCDDCAIGTDGFGSLPDNTPANDGTDLDGDGICNVTDLCDADPVKTDPGICGCGVADTDTDGDTDADCDDTDDDNDGVADGSDSDALDPSVCTDADLDGCDDCAIGTDGFGPLPDNTPANDGTDLDGDGICSVTDLCDADPAKTDPGICGCGMADTDTDGDSDADCNDPDDDNDGVPDGAGSTRVAPDLLLAQIELTGVLGDVDDDPDAPDSNWLIATSNNVSTEAGVSFPAPGGVLVAGPGLQEFRFLVRQFDQAQSGVPTARVELWENGLLLRSGPEVPVTGTAQVISFLWDASELTAAEGTLVECRLVATRAAGSPAVRNTVDIGAIEWNPTVDADPAPLDPDLCGDADGDACDDCAIGTDDFGPLPDNDSANDGTDADSDGVCSTTDLCDDDPAKTDPGICGCGEPDVDTDGDGVLDCLDPCPLDNPDDTDGDGVCDTDDVCSGNDASGDTDADGVCDDVDACPLDNPDDSDGDGVCDTDDICPGADDNLDSDSDGTPDCLDLCPNDPDKIDPGICGCGEPDVDTDGDGALDCVDPCPLDNPDDSDGDGVCDTDDLCPGLDDTKDTDNDGTPDCLDLCPVDPDKITPGQCGCGIPDTDTDTDGTANCLDPDDDNDGVLDMADCASLLPGVAKPPTPVNGTLRLSREVDTTMLRWLDTYQGHAANVYRATRNAGAGDTGMECLVTETLSPQANDADDPPPGVLHLYLVGTRNICTDSIIGQASDGPAYAAPAPCAVVNGDADGDLVPDLADNCAEAVNAGQTDGDGDFVGNACDNCPLDFNPDQSDRDRDGTGDLCDGSPGS